MPKHTRVAIIMAAMVIFAVVMLDLIRSKVEASGRAFKEAEIQYTTIKKIYATPSDVVRSAQASTPKAQIGQ